MSQPILSLHSSTMDTEMYSNMVADSGSLCYHGNGLVSVFSQSVSINFPGVP